MTAAVPLVLQQDLATSRRFVPVLASSESVAYQAQAAEMVDATVEKRRGRLHIEAYVRNLQTQRNRRMVQADGDLIDAANEIAKDIDPHASDYSTKNSQALQALAEAARTSDAKAQQEDLKQAIELDPGFGAAYLNLARVLARSGDKDIQTVLANARAHEQAFVPLDRARFDELAARISHAPLKERASTASAVLHLAPNDLEALTNLAAMRFLQGDSSGAALLQQASGIDPDNASIRLALGEGLLETKQFSKAEEVFKSLAKDPDVLPDLAVCLLLEGESGRADSVFAKYVAGLKKAKEPFAPLAEANWLAISGRMPNALAGLEAAEFTQPDFESLAWSQIAVWQSATRDAADAKKSAAQATKLAKADIARIFAAMASLIARGELSPDEWKAEVAASPLVGSARQVILGYGLFLSGRYAEAAKVWQAMVRASGNTDLRARAMLASSLDRAGKKNAAAKILVQPFLPNLTGGDLYAAVAFIEMQRMLGLKLSLGR